MGWQAYFSALKTIGTMYSHYGMAFACTPFPCLAPKATLTDFPDRRLAGLGLRAEWQLGGDLRDIDFRHRKNKGQASKSRFRSRTGPEERPNAVACRVYNLAPIRMTERAWLSSCDHSCRCQGKRPELLTFLERSCTAVTLTELLSQAIQV